MSEKILFVDDDPNILTAFQRRLGKQFVIETALDGDIALNMLKSQGPYAVVISDMNMPVMNGIEFLSKAKEINPNAVRMMLTGNADMKTAIEAVHRGNVFRFLVKPFPAEELAIAIDAGIAQYRLVNAERELLEKTLSGTIRVLIEILSSLDPGIFGRAQLLKQHMRSLAEYMRLPNLWKLELAALLAQIGIVTIPQVVLHRVKQRQSLTDKEKALLNSVPAVSSNLLSNIPRLEEISEIIRYQSKNYDGTGSPDSALAGEAIPLGSRILKVLIQMIDQESQGIPKHKALSTMLCQPEFYDQKIVEAAFACFVSAPNGVLSQTETLQNAA